jgi:hypothetical protein
MPAVKPAPAPASPQLKLPPGSGTVAETRAERRTPAGPTGSPTLHGQPENEVDDNLSVRTGVTPAGPPGSPTLHGQPEDEVDAKRSVRTGVTPAGPPGSPMLQGHCAVGTFALLPRWPPADCGAPASATGAVAATATSSTTIRLVRVEMFMVPPGGGPPDAACFEFHGFCSSETVRHWNSTFRSSFRRLARPTSRVAFTVEGAAPKALQTGPHVVFGAVLEVRVVPSRQ